jgi:hypothetical protein
MSIHSFRDNDPKLIARIGQITGIPPLLGVDIVLDTSEFMNIHRGQVLQVGDVNLCVLGDLREVRFGLEDPKYWVKKCIDLADGSTKIVKLVFHEEFIVHIGPLSIRCYRDPEKEGTVLELVKGDLRFMHGYTVRDTVGNNVRIIDFIKGKNIFETVFNIDMRHEEYFNRCLPGILYNLVGCFQAIDMLHANALCHGDIRNDHIIIEADTGRYRWIDFDLKQSYSDFDIWGIGNVLCYCIGKGMKTFQGIDKSNEFSVETLRTLTPEDASAFYNYRVMNLRKLYPYIPESLNNVLLHFARGAEVHYERLSDLIHDLQSALEDCPKPEVGSC